MSSSADPGNVLRVTGAARGMWKSSVLQPVPLHLCTEQPRGVTEFIGFPPPNPAQGPTAAPLPL